MVSCKKEGDAKMKKDYCQSPPPFLSPLPLLPPPYPPPLQMREWGPLVIYSI